MSSLGQAALIFPAASFHHYNTQVTFYIKLVSSNGHRWDCTIADIVPATDQLNKIFGRIMASRSRQSWSAFAEYLMIQHLVGNCANDDIDMYGWHQGLLLRIDWNTKLFTTSCRYFYVTIRQELDHELTSSSSESDDEF